MATTTKNTKKTNDSTPSAMLRNYAKNRNVHNLALKRRSGGAASITRAKMTGAKAKAPGKEQPFAVTVSASQAAQSTTSELAEDAPASAPPEGPKGRRKGAKRGKAGTAAARGAAATPAGRPARDPRLPQAGTTLKKLDRQGAVRCECLVADDGIKYNGATYRSLSAAAVAAAKDLGIGGAQNGYVFWGLVKPARTAGADPLTRLQRSWERYSSLARSLVQTVTEGRRPEVVAAIEHHRTIELV